MRPDAASSAPPTGAPRNARPGSRSPSLSAGSRRRTMRGLTSLSAPPPCCLRCAPACAPRRSSASPTVPAASGPRPWASAGWSALWWSSTTPPVPGSPRPSPPGSGWPWWVPARRGWRRLSTWLTGATPSPSMSAATAPAVCWSTAFPT